VAPALADAALAPAVTGATGALVAAAFAGVGWMRALAEAADDNGIPTSNMPATRYCVSLAAYPFTRLLPTCLVPPFPWPAHPDGRPGAVPNLNEA